MINFNILQNIAKSTPTIQTLSDVASAGDDLGSLFNGISSLVGTRSPSTPQGTITSINNVSTGPTMTLNKNFVDPSTQNLNELYKRPAFQTALEAQKKAQADGITKSPIMTVVDYSIPSDKPRMWVVDTQNNKILMNTYVAQGSTPGFSNIPNSHQSSLGTFQTGEIYQGKHGQSMRLHGLEKGVNDNAFKRAIVVHGGDYVGPDKHGTSWGCFTVPNDVAPKLIGLTKDGTIIHSYAPSQKTLQNFSKTLPKQSMSNLMDSLHNKMSNIGNELPHIIAGISGVESSDAKDPYKLISKPSKNGDRAYGYSQIMGNNIPSWTKEALGYPMTIKQYINNPEAQKKTTEYQVNKIYQQYKNPEDVWSIWFSGRPANQAGNARDAYGTTVPQYINKANQFYMKSRAGMQLSGNQNYSPNFNQNNQSWNFPGQPPGQKGGMPVYNPNSSDRMPIAKDDLYFPNEMMLTDNSKPALPPLPNIPAFNPQVPIRNLSPQEIEAIMKHLHGMNGAGLLQRIIV